MKKITIILLATLFIAFTSCKVKVSNSTDAEAVPVRMVGVQPPTNSTDPTKPPPPTTTARKIISYNVLVAQNIDILKRDVLAEMEKGWQPFGSVTVQGSGVIQTMVQYQ